MSLLKVKKKRRCLTNRFYFVVENAIVYNRVRNKWILRIPREILASASFHTGDHVDLNVENRALIVRKLPVNKRTSLRRQRGAERWSRE